MLRLPRLGTTALPALVAGGDSARRRRSRLAAAGGLRWGRAGAPVGTMLGAGCLPALGGLARSLCPLQWPGQLLGIVQSEK